MRTQFTVALLLLCTSLYAADPAWIEYGPDGPLARTIVTDGGHCPHITIDGVETKMTTHAEPAKNYEVHVCEALLPQGVRSASIGEVALPVAKLGKSAKVAILGDTGCRLKAASGKWPAAIQDCSDPKAWPFAAIAKSIAAWDPDVVLHVGDYYYREAVCEGTKCKPSTYNWKRWNEDFFTPAAPLLANTPWILVRGNHEDCSRAAEGWFRFLDPRNYVWENAKTCNSNWTYTPPYPVSAGDLHVTVVDSSAVKSWDAQQATIFANQLGLLAKAQPDTWLMLHHPFWAIDGTDADTQTLWTAWQQAGSAVSPVSLVLTGHIHLLEMFSFTDNGVPNIVAGNGGTALDKAPSDGVGFVVGPRTVARATYNDQFGFITATPSANGWTLVLRDASGEAKTNCAMTASGIVCD